jgi:hypothetical protein
MLGGYLHPGKPVANMYFTLVGYNTVSQGQLLLRDLKLGQYTHLSPRCLFTVQVIGTLIGGALSYVIMDTITTNQRDILLSIEGTNIWSGQVLQSYVSALHAKQRVLTNPYNRILKQLPGEDWLLSYFLLAKDTNGSHLHSSLVSSFPFHSISFINGSLAFDSTTVRNFLKLDNDLKTNKCSGNTAIISYYIGWLSVGINSSILSFFVVGFFSQFWLRKYKPEFFREYNYILSAAMDGGTQVLTFILTFALFGGAGHQVQFPSYWGNAWNKGNYDLCLKDPGSAGQ